jgi:hypothetical protein
VNAGEGRNFMSITGAGGLRSARFGLRVEF